jgi:hypothetical protein
MKIIAAYLLAVLGGNAAPSADDIKTILASGSYLSFFGYVFINLFCFFVCVQCLFFFFVFVCKIDKY